MQNEKEKFKEDEEAGELYKECNEISKVIGSSVLTLKGKR